MYLRGIFQFFRIVHDYTIGLLPIPSLYLIAPAFFYFFYRKQFRSIKPFLIATLTCLVWIVVFFYLLWGINYTQPQLKKVLELPPPNIDSIYIKTAFLEQTEIVSALAKSNITYPKLKEIEDEIRVHQEDILKDWNVPTVGRVRIRKLPAGSLLRIRTSGIYIPHAFEGHLDGGLYYKQHPFTMAHEMAHALHEMKSGRKTPERTPEIELDADRVGLILLARAGYDPSQLATFWAQQIDLFGADFFDGGQTQSDSHPDLKRRADNYALTLSYIRAAGGDTDLLKALIVAPQ